MATTVPARKGWLVLTAVWLGLVAGWVELGVDAIGRVLDPRVTFDMTRTNHHAAWMIPLADTLLIGLAALLIAAIRRWASWADFLTLRVPLALAVGTVLLSIDGVYGAASLSLACGVAIATAPLLERRAGGLEPFIRRTFPWMAAGLTLWCAGGYAWVATAERRALAKVPSARQGSPNVLLLVLDTVRADNLSLHGHDRPTAPNIERLAARGLAFRQARSTAPWTLPSHASMMTGRWAYELSTGPAEPLDGRFPTLAEALGRRGYATGGFVGNTYYCSSRYGLGRGFHRYEAAYENRVVSLFEIVRSSGLGKRIVHALGYPVWVDEDGPTARRKTAEMINHDLLAWLDGRPAERPFFAFVNYYDAHRPYQLPGTPDLHYGLAALPQETQAEINRRYVESSRGKTGPGEVALDEVALEAMRLYHDSYDSSIAYIDRQIGVLTNELERRGLLENTLVIVTSDHGEQLGEHGLISHGTSLFRQETHVPLVVVPPGGVAGGRQIGDAVSIRDIPATVASFVFPEAADDFPGQTLTRFQAGGPASSDPVLTELQHLLELPPDMNLPPTHGPGAAVVAGDYVYIRSVSGHEQLFALADDPYEQNDLVGRPELGPTLARLRGEMQRLRRDSPVAARGAFPSGSDER